MRFPDPLIPGRLVRRYKRFLADVELEDGRMVTAHCPNPGSMLGLTTPGSEVWLSPARNPKRKLRFTFEMIRVNGDLVGVNTGLPNTLVEEALRAGRISELAGYTDIRREVRYGRNSRIDLLLQEPERPDCYLEVKNVHMKRDPRRRAGAAEFPDSVTARGAKHLGELSNMAAQGMRAVIFYAVQRMDCDGFRVAADIDAAYDAAFQKALAGGVEALCYSCKLSLEAIELHRPLPMEL